MAENEETQMTQANAGTSTCPPGSKTYPPGSERPPPEILFTRNAETFKRKYRNNGSTVTKYGETVKGKNEK